MKDKRTKKTVNVAEKFCCLYGIEPGWRQLQDFKQWAQHVFIEVIELENKEYVRILNVNEVFIPIEKTIIR